MTAQLEVVVCWLYCFKKLKLQIRNSVIGSVEEVGLVVTAVVSAVKCYNKSVTMCTQNQNVPGHMCQHAENF